MRGNGLPAPPRGVSRLAADDVASPANARRRWAHRDAARGTVRALPTPRGGRARVHRVARTANVPGGNAIASPLMTRMDDQMTEINRGKALFDAAYPGAADAAGALLVAGAPLDARERPGHTPRTVAAANGHEDVAELLSEWGADVNTSDLAGRTPLMVAAIGGHTDTTRLLLENNAMPNAATIDGLTALMYASMFRHRAVCVTL